MKHVKTPWIKSPYQLITIIWKLDCFIGSIDCEAWRGQYEIERLESSGYVILDVTSV